MLTEYESTSNTLTTFPDTRAWSHPLSYHLDAIKFDHSPERFYSNSLSKGLELSSEGELSLIVSYKGLGIDFTYDINKEELTSLQTSFKGIKLSSDGKLTYSEEIRLGIPRVYGQRLIIQAIAGTGLDLKRPNTIPFGAGLSINTLSRNKEEVKLKFGVSGSIYNYAKDVYRLPVLERNLAIYVLLANAMREVDEALKQTVDNAFNRLQEP